MRADPKRVMRACVQRVHAVLDRSHKVCTCMPAPVCHTLAPIVPPQLAACAERQGGAAGMHARTLGESSRCVLNRRPLAPACNSIPLAAFPSATMRYPSLLEVYPSRACHGWGHALRRKALFSSVVTFRCLPVLLLFCLPPLHLATNRLPMARAMRALYWPRQSACTLCLTLPAIRARHTHTPHSAVEPTAPL